MNPSLFCCGECALQPLSQASSAPSGKQMAAVVAALQRMLKENKLLMAMDEVKSLRKFAKTTGGVTLKVLDGKGVIKVSVQHGQYEFVVRCTTMSSSCRCLIHPIRSLVLL